MEKRKALLGVGDVAVFDVFVAKIATSDGDDIVLWQTPKNNCISKKW
jgi:hypothetical protein